MAVRVAAVAVPLIIVVSVAGYFVRRGSGGSANPGPGQTALAGLQTGPAPWPPELAHLRERLQALGLPAQPSMAETLHFHDHLDIYIDGQAVQVPQNVGINQGEGYLTSVHTHDTSGIIHIESPTNRAFTLGQFFDVWGVRFTPSCLGGYCASGGATLRVFANGQPVTGDPRQLPLTPHEEIVVVYGTAPQLPSPMPSSYSFPGGL